MPLVKEIVEGSRPETTLLPAFSRGKNGTSHAASEIFNNYFLQAHLVTLLVQIMEIILRKFGIIS